MNLQPIGFGIELPQVTFEPVSTVDRNPIRQAWFCCFALPSDLLTTVLITKNMYAQRPHVCIKTNLHVIDLQLCVIRTTGLTRCFIPNLCPLTNEKPGQRNRLVEDGTVLHRCTPLTVHCVHRHTFVQQGLGHLYKHTRPGKNRAYNDAHPFAST